MQPTTGAGGLNSAQKLHLLSSAQYADKLLADIESILSVASSKSPFPKYQNDLTLAQMKVVQDYLARMRSQTDEIREMGDGALAAIAIPLVDLSQGNRDDQDSGSIIRETLTRVAADKAAMIVAQLGDLATMLAHVLESAAEALNMPDAPTQNEFMEVLKEMPRIDVGTLDAEIHPTLLGRVSRSLARRQIENDLRKQIGTRVVEAFSSYGLQSNFDSQADAYRALLGGLMAESETNPPEDDALIRDLDRLARVESGDALVDATARS